MCIRDRFEEIVKKTGQVCIQIRDVQGVDDNPFDFETIKNPQHKCLEDGNHFMMDTITYLRK